MSLSNIKVNNSSVIGIDDAPIDGSENLVKSGGVALELYKSFIKELYLDNSLVDVSQPFIINNIARDFYYPDGTGPYWYVQFTLGNLNGYISTSNKNIAKSFCLVIFNINGTETECGKILINWDSFPKGLQLRVHIEYTFNYSSDYQPRYFLQNKLQQTIQQYTENKLDKLIPIYTWDSNNILTGYLNTNRGTTLRFNVGDTVSLSGPEFRHACIKVTAGDIIYVGYLEPTSYTISYPFVTDKNLKVLEIIDCETAQHKNINNIDYIYFTITKNGYLFISGVTNKYFTIYSDKPLLEEIYNLPIRDPEQPFSNYFNYEVALSLPKSLLIGMIESASNGCCTVIYDDNDYPSLMYRIPLTSIGALSSELGDFSTPHPAFVVNGVTKKHIYAGVFMNSSYNGVPVSWWGLDNILTSKSFSQCKTLCAQKGTGWHLETIWERSLISLLSRKYHNTDKPRGNNNRGCSYAAGYEYECVESIQNTDIPGSFPNGGQWLNGTQPTSWSHNNSRWGIFDIIGAFHEWCNLAKIDTNGKIYLCSDNNYNGDESNWIDTGVYLTWNSSSLYYNTAQDIIQTDIHTQQRSTVFCSEDYDSISLDLRKKLVLSLLVPRLSSSDNPLFDFDGTIWLRNNIGNCYPFMGGALEYPASGLGYLILSYDENEAHNNMGSRLFYIE